MHLFTLETGQKLSYNLNHDISDRSRAKVCLATIDMEDIQSSKTPAMALRDSFGDRRIPDISRKVTACVACRKQKVRSREILACPDLAQCQPDQVPHE